MGAILPVQSRFAQKTGGNALLTGHGEASESCARPLSATFQWQGKSRLHGLLPDRGPALGFIGSSQAEHGTLFVAQALLHGSDLLRDDRPETGLQDAHLADHLTVVTATHAAGGLFLHGGDGFNRVF
jgi:hypothetical protein